MRLYMSYMKMHLKTALEYKTSLILTGIAQGLTMLIELYTIYALFQKFSLLSEYDVNELIVGFSSMWLGFSLAETFGRGFDTFSKLIVNGNFDMLLIRPRTLFVQIIGSDAAYEKFARIICSLGLYIYSGIKIIGEVTWQKVLLLIEMPIGCAVIILGLFIIGATISFFTIQGLEAINIFTNGTKQVSEYPLGIYNKAIKFVFTFIIPIAIANYYPIEYLTSRTSDWWYVVLPLLSVIPFALSLSVFKIGLNKYTSTGS